MSNFEERINWIIHPGMVLGLRHSINFNNNPLSNPISSYGAWLEHIEGGDRGASSGQGFKWWMIKDSRPVTSTKLPSGIVLSLTHTLNLTNRGITFMGYDPLAHNVTPPGLLYEGGNYGFHLIEGGDRGAPSGHGFRWFESYASNYSDWDKAEKYLPKGTIWGLKHSQNQKDKRFVWRNETYDPYSPRGVGGHLEQKAPPGFIRRIGGDLGAPSGHGFFWFEKITGPNLFSGI